jgi:hypothetical protein
MKDGKAIAIKKAKAVQPVTVETLIPVRLEQLEVRSASGTAVKIRTSPQIISAYLRKQGRF